MSNVIGMQVQGQLAEITQLRFVDVKNSNIVEYTAQFTKFYDDKGTRTDRRDAEFLWSYEVRNSYLKDDPNFERLLSQVHSPANEEFWAHRMDPTAYQLRKQLEAHFGFWVFPRQPTEAESKADPGLLILGDNSSSFLLPGYNFKPMTDIEFATFALTLIMCNPSHKFDCATIGELWSTLVHKVYHFESDDVKIVKLREADFPSGTAEDAETSTAVPTAPTPTAGPMIVQAFSDGSLRRQQPLEQQLKQKQAEVKQLRQQLASFQGRTGRKSHK